MTVLAGLPAATTDKVSPGFAGFLAVFVLAVATVLLIRSMVKHLRKVRYSPGPEGEPAPQDVPAPDPAAGSTPEGTPGKGNPAKS